MMEQLAIRVTREAIFYVLAFSAPPLILAMVLGLSIALVSAVTQVQEQTLTAVPKMFSVFIVLAVMANWMMASLVKWTTQLFALIPVYF